VRIVTQCLFLGAWDRRQHKSSEPSGRYITLPASACPMNLKKHKVEKLPIKQIKSENEIVVEEQSINQWLARMSLKMNEIIDWINKHETKT
jgi:hypothetical protein